MKMNATTTNTSTLHLPLVSLLKQSLFHLNSTMFDTFLFPLFLIALFLFNLTIRQRRSKSKQNLPPSPPKLPLIGNLHQLGTLPHRSFKDLSLKYGPLLSLKLGQTPAIVVSSIDLARDMINSQGEAFCNRFQPQSSKIIFYGNRDIAFASYGESWRLKKKLCVLELLSLKRVRSFQFIRDEEIAAMVDQIRNACLNGNGCVNASDLITSTSNNIICRCIIGQRYDNGDKSSMFAELARKEMVQLAELNVGDLFPSLGWIDYLTGKIQEIKGAFRALDAFFDQVILEHKKAKKDNDDDDDKKDFVDILLQQQESDKLEFEPHQDNLKALITEMFLGGNDSSSTGIEWTLTHLIRNPRVMKKAQEEVRRVVGNNKSRIDEKELSQMKYLKMVIKESFRLTPPAPFLIPRESRLDAKLGGYNIPAKTLIFLNIWAIQRDPQVWERPEEFIPERFENCQVDYKGLDFELLPFGSGKRMCPGMAFAIASTEYLLASFLYWFDWELPDGEDEVDMGEVYGLTVKKKLPLRLKATPYSFPS